MRPSKELIMDLNLDQLGINIDYMVNGYCNRMEHDGRCSMAKRGNCDLCFPELKVIVTEDLDSAENIPAVIMWRMKAYAKREINVYASAPKKPVLPEHEYVDPIKGVLRELGMDDLAEKLSMAPKHLDWLD